MPPTDLEMLRQRVDSHQAAIEQMESSTQRMLDKMDRVADELSKLTTCFREYTIKHEYVEKQNDKMRVEVDLMDSEIRLLQQHQAASQPIIDGVRSLNAKLIWFVVAAVLSPIGAAFAILSKGQ